MKLHGYTISDTIHTRKSRPVVPNWGSTGKDFWGLLLFYVYDESIQCYCKNVVEISIDYKANKLSSHVSTKSKMKRSIKVVGTVSGIPVGTDRRD